MAADRLKIALYYDDGAYQETLNHSAQRSLDSPAGLMGREVAGKEFLDAYLSYGTWAELVALTPNQPSARSIGETCRTHPSSRARRRRLQLFSLDAFHDTFLPQPPAPLLHFPSPPDPMFAWARQQGHPHGFALSGVTHTLCSARIVRVLRELVTAPFESYDRLICTSRAVSDMVEAVCGTYAEYLRVRHGGAPSLRIGLETIPLGVNTDKFRPATAGERAAERKRLKIAEDELAVLFVGRLAHHAKAHPFPMYRGVGRAAEHTGKKVCLILTGWAPNDQVAKAFEEAARAFASPARLMVLDGLKPQNRFGAWRAADVFLSLSDNIQETFGLVVVEAMAGGLPVVASDWNGYRDLVVDGETGFLIPTTMIRDATRDVTSRLLTGEVNYDHFLAQCSQCVAVDCSATAKALVRLFEDAPLRRRMGRAGRQRAVRQFAWSRVISAYEALWRQQDEERSTFLSRGKSTGPAAAAQPGPAAYPAPELSFAGYPTAWLDADQTVVADPDALNRLTTVRTMPLTNHSARFRSSDAAVLQKLLAQAAGSCSLGELEQQLQEAGLTHQAARATLAWMMKYDLLRLP